MNPYYLVADADTAIELDTWIHNITRSQSGKVVRVGHDWACLHAEGGTGVTAGVAEVLTRLYGWFRSGLRAV